MDERAQALADYLDIDISEIEVNDDYSPTEYITPEGTYWVLDESESIQEVYDYIENIIDELGIYGAFTPNFTSWIEENALDQDWFKDTLYEQESFYAQDIEYESDDEYGNRLNAECIENGVISEDEIVDGEYIGDEDLYDLLATSFVDKIKDSRSSFSKEFENQYGDDSLTQVIKEHPSIIDLDAIVDEAIRWDGYGHFIASYDSVTNELEDDLYAYRID